MICRAGLYRIKNKINNKVYYGSSINVESRILDHKFGIRSNIYLQRSITKYGINNFTFEILVYCDIENLLMLEQILLNLVRIVREDGTYGEINQKLSFNLCPVAGNSLGFKHTEETKYKLSIDRIGEKSPWFGKKHSDKTKEKMSKNNAMKNPEVAKKASLRMIGDGNPNFGKHLDETHRNKISDALVGREFSEEHKKNLSIAETGANNHMFGKERSAESKHKQSESIRGENNPFFGKKHSEETKQKIRDSLKLYRKK
ncbi:MAG: NUMOD3 domain-containing DNA-binding protein [Patescibacteria group bacterium]|jgi:group I intron endonuclease